MAPSPFLRADSPCDSRIVNRRLALWFVAASPLAVPALLLFGCASTFEGRLSAVCALLVVAAVAFRLACRPRLTLAIAGALVAGGVVLIARAPSADAPLGVHVRAHHLLGGRGWRIAPTLLVPEVDQLVLATYLVPFVDPLMTTASAARLRGALRDVYASVERDPEFHALGSAMGDAIRDIDSGRVFVYEPPHAPGQRLPAVIFLHGSAGSWKGYFHVLVELARRRGLAVAQPSFGFGEWNRAGGVEAVERTRRWLVAQTWVDPSRLYLACLSNGGRGVTRVMRRGPARYRGLIFVSAVVEPSVLDAGPFDPSWRSVPALVIHGGRDDRVPLGYMNDGVAALREQGLRVRYAVVPEEDHYFIFTARERLKREIVNWLDADDGGAL